jgi:hypothetical protein
MVGVLARDLPRNRLLAIRNVKSLQRSQVHGQWKTPETFSKASASRLHLHTNTNTDYQGTSLDWRETESLTRQLIPPSQPCNAENVKRSLRREQGIVRIAHGRSSVQVITSVTQCRSQRVNSLDKIQITTWHLEKCVILKFKEKKKKKGSNFALKNLGILEDPPQLAHSKPYTKWGWIPRSFQNSNSILTLFRIFGTFERHLHHSQVRPCWLQQPMPL